MQNHVANLWAISRSKVLHIHERCANTLVKLHHWQLQEYYDKHKGIYQNISYWDINREEIENFHLLRQFKEESNSFIDVFELQLILKYIFLLQSQVTLSSIGWKIMQD